MKDIFLKVWSECNATDILMLGKRSKRCGSAVQIAD